ncbi:MAG: DnaJ domain-containing protein [Candidatus Sericytochromatia bacterium]
MNLDRVCGNCAFGAEAYDRYGNVDPNYVICQIKEAENRQRKPDRFNTSSAVSRMHHQREACLHWKGDYVGETPLPTQSAAAATVSQAPESLYDQMYGASSGAEPETEWRPQTYAAPTYVAPTHAAPPRVQRDQHVAMAENEAEIKKLKSLLMQQEQMVISLQNQNQMLSEELTRLRDELGKTSQKLEKLKPFDVALFAEVNFFSLLGVKENATPDQIKEAYRTRMKLLHPDRFINISQRLNQAYETLMDADKRRKYLQQIKGK